MIKGMRAYLPVLVAVLLAACSRDENIDFEAQGLMDTGEPPPLLEIFAPESGAVLPAGKSFILEYETVRGDKGAYVEIYLDKQKPVKVKGTRGPHQIDGLSPGKHVIYLVERTVDGRKTGGEARIVITAE